MRRLIRGIAAIAMTGLMTAPTGAAAIPAKIPPPSCGVESVDSDCWPKPQWICFVGIIMMENYCDRDLQPNHCPF